MTEEVDRVRTIRRTWTRTDDYFEALARRRTARKSREAKPGSRLESPRLLLSTVPFLLLLAGLAILAVGIMIAAWPRERDPAAPQSVQAAQGVAPKGWYQKAEREFHR